MFLTPLIAFIILISRCLCLGKDRNIQIRSKDTHVQRNTAYLLTTVLGRSTWRLAAKDPGNGSILTHFPFGIHYCCHISLLSCCFFPLSHHMRRLSTMLPGWHPPSLHQRRKNRQSCPISRGSFSMSQHELEQWRGVEESLAKLVV